MSLKRLTQAIKRLDKLGFFEVYGQGVFWDEGQCIVFTRLRNPDSYLCWHYSGLQWQAFFPNGKDHDIHEFTHHDLLSYGMRLIGNLEGAPL